MSMRFRPAHISVINRRACLPAKSVEEANQRARIPFDEIVEVVELTPEAV